MKVHDDELAALVRSILAEKPEVDLQTQCELVRIAVENGHPILGGKKFDTPKQKAIFAAIIAAVSEPLKQSNEAAKPAPLYEPAFEVLPESSRVTLEELRSLGVNPYSEKHEHSVRSARCPKCRCEALTLALLDIPSQLVLCDNCLDNYVGTMEPRPLSVRLVWYPRVVFGEGWERDQESFKSLRKYLDDCFTTDRKNYSMEILPKRPETLCFLIDLLSRCAADGVQASDERRALIERAVRRFTGALVPWLRGEFNWSPELPVRTVHWRLLEAPEHSWNEILTHYERIQRVRGEKFDVNRLRFIYDLRPSELYIGLGSFEGYVAFVFKRKRMAVLDCPKIGNAIYAMKAAVWVHLSQLSKSELLAQHRHEVQRIVHSECWRAAVKHLVT